MVLGVALRPRSCSDRPAYRRRDLDRPDGLALRGRDPLARRRSTASPTAVLLSVFPILAVFAAFGRPGRSAPARGARRGALALVVSLAFTAVYHLGYSDFRSEKLRKPLAGDVVWSAPTLAHAEPVRRADRPRRPPRRRGRPQLRDRDVPAAARGRPRPPAPGSAAAARRARERFGSGSLPARSPTSADRAELGLGSRRLREVAGHVRCGPTPGCGSRASARSTPRRSSTNSPRNAPLRLDRHAGEMASRPLPVRRGSDAWPSCSPIERASPTTTSRGPARDYLALIEDPAFAPEPSRGASR